MICKIQINSKAGGGGEGAEVYMVLKMRDLDDNFSENVPRIMARVVVPASLVWKKGIK